MEDKNNKPFALANYMPGKIFTQEKLISSLPFILFLSGLGLLSISNSYYAEKTIREIDAAIHRTKDLRSEYISVKSDLMLLSRQSEIAKQVERLGLKESVVPPGKIVVTQNQGHE